MSLETRNGRWWRFFAYGEGGQLIPFEVVGDHTIPDPIDGDPNDRIPTPEWLQDFTCADTVEDLEVISGWSARLTMPGFLDCTDWIGVHETEDLALQALDNLYPEDDYEDPSSECASCRGTGIGNPHAQTACYWCRGTGSEPIKREQPEP